MKMKLSPSVREGISIRSIKGIFHEIRAPDVAGSGEFVPAYSLDNSVRTGNPCERVIVIVGSLSR